LFVGLKKISFVAKIHIKNIEVKVAKCTKKGLFLGKLCSSSMKGFPPPKAAYIAISRCLSIVYEVNAQDA